jgi:hypothetical protein
MKAITNPIKGPMAPRYGPIDAPILARELVNALSSRRPAISFPS